MPYDEKFWRAYEEYLNEPSVRRSHDFAFRHFGRLIRPENWFFVDLGCGIGEFERYGHHQAYAGIDLADTNRVDRFIQANYLDFRFIERLSFTPRACISLFSIEACYNAKDKYALYERIFREIPTINYVVVSGFFYESRRGQETVEENGKIVSYQTIEDPSLFMSDTFAELRMHIRTPSKMFGEDVVEVWKLLVRS
ncbi:MAG: class I SAM-dependent methyltransferase [bacterium]|nr:class I SAM-dependent methyltransferase [bacterium]